MEAGEKYIEEQNMRTSGFVQAEDEEILMKCRIFAICADKDQERYWLG